MPRLAVIGFPVGHSRSPAMQSAALAELGLGEEWSYGAIEVAPEGFEAKVRELAAGGEYAGVNVTVPHKEAALALADEASEAATAIGAANTLSFDAGRIHADNTDAGGLLAALPTTPLDARTLVLGAGGAARAVIWALVGEGARVEVWNRTAARAAEICAQLGGKPVADPDQAEYDLIVNTTSVGLRGEDPFAELPLSAGGFVPGQLVVDMVYGAGAGLYADVVQAVPAFSSRQPEALSLGQFALARLAAGERLLDSIPLYLRESDAQVPGPRKRAL